MYKVSLKNMGPAAMFTTCSTRREIMNYRRLIAVFIAHVVIYNKSP